MEHTWESLEHDWKEEDGWGNYIEVKCTICGVPGEKDLETGEIYFPTT